MRTDQSLMGKLAPTWERQQREQSGERETVVVREEGRETTAFCSRPQRQRTRAEARAHQGQSVRSFKSTTDIILGPAFRWPTIIRGYTVTFFTLMARGSFFSLSLNKPAFQGPTNARISDNAHPLLVSLRVSANCGRSSRAGRGDCQSESTLFFLEKEETRECSRT